MGYRPIRNPPSPDEHTDEPHPRINIAQAGWSELAPVIVTRLRIPNPRQIEPNCTSSPRHPSPY